MNETLKTIINIVSLAVLVTLFIISIHNTKKDCKERINESIGRELKCYADLGMYKIDLNQCRDYELIASESLWDCQEKWDLCLDTLENATKVR